jgi:hypothetical protein
MSDARKVSRAAAKDRCHRRGRCVFPTEDRAAEVRLGPALALPALVLLLFAACRPAKDSVVAAVDSLVEGANKRDRSAIVKRLTPDFQAADGSNFADMDQRIRQVFAGYDSLSVTLSGLTVERGNEVALARFRLDLSGAPAHFGGLEGLLPRSSRYKFELRLVPAGGQWKVAWASWEEEGR